MPEFARNNPTAVTQLDKSWEGSTRTSPSQKGADELTYSIVEHNLDYEVVEPGGTGQLMAFSGLFANAFIVKSVTDEAANFVNANPFE